MERKEGGQVQDHTDHRRRDAGKGVAQPDVAAQRLDIRRAEEDEEEARHEGHPGGDEGAEQGRGERVEGSRVAVGAEEGHKLHHHDERTRGGFGQAQAVEHFARRQPAIGRNRFLADVGQHGISAAEGDNRRLAEKHGLIEHHVVAAEPAEQQQRRCAPNQQPDQQHPQGTPERRGAGAGSRISQAFPLVACGCFELAAAEQEPGQRRAGNDGGEGDVEKEKGAEGGDRRREVPGAQQGLAADAPERFDHHCHHRRFEPVKKPGQKGGVAKKDVNQRKPQNGDHAGQHKKHAGQ